MTLSAREMLDALLAQLDASDEGTSDTEPGRAHLAEFWGGELDTDLAEPVIRQIRFDQFVREVVSMGTGIAIRMGTAALEYSVGSDDEATIDEPSNDQPGDEEKWRQR